MLHSQAVASRVASIPPAPFWTGPLHFHVHGMKEASCRRAHTSQVAPALQQDGPLSILDAPYQAAT